MWTQLYGRPFPHDPGFVDLNTIMQNSAEVETVVALIQRYYSDKDYCVLTPYDAQRSAIEKRFRALGLPGGRVFNVDSFQGMLSHLC